MKLTLDHLRCVLRYDVDTGRFSWLAPTARSLKSGDTAGCLESDGYRAIRVGGQMYKAHRLAYFYVHGEWPPEQLDHINGKRDDNRIVNLRLATRAENAGNSKRRTDNTSGHKGVYWNRQRNKWQAKIRRGALEKHLGLFSSKEDAAEAYRKASATVFGDFACIDR